MAGCTAVEPVNTAGTAAALPAGACPDCPDWTAAAWLAEESGSTLISLFGTGVSLSTVSGLLAQLPDCGSAATARVGV